MQLDQQETCHIFEVKTSANWALSTEGQEVAKYATSGANVIYLIGGLGIRRTVVRRCLLLCTSTEKYLIGRESVSSNRIDLQSSDLEPAFLELEKI